MSAFSLDYICVLLYIVIVMLIQCNKNILKITKMGVQGDHRLRYRGIFRRMEKDYAEKGINLSARAISASIKKGRNVERLEAYEMMRAVMDYERITDRKKAMVLLRKLNDGGKRDAIKQAQGVVGKVIKNSNKYGDVKR